MTTHIDDAPITRFHLRVCTYTVGGMFCDGYIIGSIGLALPLLTQQMGLGPWWEGALAAAALIGIFAGALVFGPVTDKIGRQKVLVADLMVFVVASAAQLWVTAPLTLLVLRVILGLAIGADYAIAPALLCEFVPRKQRGRLLATMNMTWTVGFIAAYAVGLILLGRLGSDSWRWMLASSAVPATLTLLMRLGSPESPRWLMNKGRHEEARAIIVKHFGAGYHIDDIGICAQSHKASYRELLTEKYRVRTFFVGMFWFCQVFPYFGIGTFLPKMVSALGIQDKYLGVFLYNLLLLCGAIAGCLIMDRLPRRSFAIWSFAIIGVAMLILAILPHGPMWLLIPAFLIVAFVLSAAADLETVYPAEVFPTEVRASGVGLASAISRAGAAISTFVLPTALANLGIGTTMLILTAVVGFGLAISIPLAPETRGVFLDEAAASPQPCEGAIP